MNHQFQYDKIIAKARLELRFQLKFKYKPNYYEKHHIIPRCIGGNDSYENIVLLTAKEHYVCHKLLTYIYPNNKKIVYAFSMMSQSFKKLRKLKLSSRDYGYIRELVSRNGKSEETKKKMSIAAMGKPKSEEAKRSMSLARKGKPHPHTKEWDINIGKANKGRISTLKGIKRPKEVMEKCRLSHVGAKRSENTKKKMRIAALKKWENPEYRKSMSEKHIGQKSWNKGKITPEEVKTKQRKPHKRRILKVA